MDLNEDLLNTKIQEIIKFPGELDTIDYMVKYGRVNYNKNCFEYLLFKDRVLTYGILSTINRKIEENDNAKSFSKTEIIKDLGYKYRAFLRKIESIKGGSDTVIRKNIQLLIPVYVNVAQNRRYKGLSLTSKGKKFLSWLETRNNKRVWFNYKRIGVYEIDNFRIVFKDFRKGVKGKLFLTENLKFGEQQQTIDVE
jgi:hypothetical protein